MVKSSNPPRHICIKQTAKVNRIKEEKGNFFKGQILLFFYLIYTLKTDVDCSDRPRMGFSTTKASREKKSSFRLIGSERNGVP